MQWKALPWAISVVLTAFASAQEALDLSEIHVRGERDSLDEAPPALHGEQVAGAARMGVLGRAALMETPFSVTSYTSATIENMQAQSIGDLLQADPSVRQTSNRSHLAEGMTIRGLAIGNSDYAQNGMFGLTPFGRTNLEAIERVEVIKGPSAALFGMAPGGSVGGVINLVPKRAGDTPITRLTLSAAQDSVLGAHLDVGRRFGQGELFGLRVNLVQREGNTRMDDQSLRRKLAAAALDFRGERLRASLDVQYSLEDVNNTARPFNMGAGDYVSDDLSAVIKLDYALFKAVNLYAGYGEHRYKADNMLLYPTLQSSNGNYSYRPTEWREQTDRSSLEAGLRGNFVSGAVSHRYALGLSRVTQDRDTFTATYPDGSGNLYQRGKIARPAHIHGKITPQTGLTLTSLALADTLGFMDERLLLTLGVRHQRVESDNPRATAVSARHYDKKELSPLVGLLYRASDSVSLYASYVEGLSQGPITPNNTTYSNANEQFAPFVTEQYELGAKFDWGNWHSALAVYSMTRPLSGDIPDTSKPPAYRALQVIGKQRTHGMEATLAGEIIHGVRVLGGVSLMDAELYQSKSPNIKKGNDIVGIAKWQANLVVEWDMPFAPGTSVHGRILHTDKRAANASNTLYTPSWQRIDAGLRYQAQHAGKRYTARLNVENLTNTRYWGVGTLLYLGAPRTLSLSLAVDI